jgi:hypothetical protein
MAATPDNHQQRIALTDAFVIGLAATRSILGDLPVAGLSREELGRWAAPGAAGPGEFGRTWSRRSLFRHRARWRAPTSRTRSVSAPTPIPASLANHPKQQRKKD